VAYLGFHFKDILKISREKNFASYGLKVHNYDDSGGHDDSDGGGDDNDRHYDSVRR
jgi:hypothetical protein